MNRTSLHTSKPRFQCNSCQSQFWISLSASPELGTVIGFPLESKATEQGLIQQEIQKKFFCSECGTDNAVGTAECRGCGVVYEKLRLRKEDPHSVEAPEEVKRYWRQLVQHFFADDQKHASFLELCARHKCLDYAAQRYSKVLKANPSDEIAAKYQARIIGIVTSVSNRREALPAKKAKVPFASIILILGGFLFTVGYLHAPYRNLMGVGASVVISVFVLRLLIRRAQTN